MFLVPLTFHYKAALVVLAFVCLQNFWFLHQIWMKALSDILSCRFSFLLFKYIVQFPSELQISAENSAESLMGVPL